MCERQRKGFTEDDMVAIMTLPRHLRTRKQYTKVLKLMEKYDRKGWKLPLDRIPAKIPGSNVSLPIRSTSSTVPVKAPGTSVQTPGEGVLKENLLQPESLCVLLKCTQFLFSQALSQCKELPVGLPADATALFQAHFQALENLIKTALGNQPKTDDTPVSKPVARETVAA